MTMQIVAHDISKRSRMKDTWEIFPTTFMSRRPCEKHHATSTEKRTRLKNANAINRYHKNRQRRLDRLFTLTLLFFPIKNQPVSLVCQQNRVEAYWCIHPMFSKTVGVPH